MSGEETIYDLFRKVREHPDYVFGTIFTVSDFETPEDAYRFKVRMSHVAHEELARAGNRLLDEEED